jgi:membrane-associated phospholipid phosphatase/SAM-dependent methyltransferase
MAGALIPGAGEPLTSARPRRGQGPGSPVGQLPRRPSLLATGLALVVLAAAFAAVIAARPARPPFDGLDRSWLAVVRTWQAGPLTDAARVFSYIGGPWGATVIVAGVVIALLLRGRPRTALFLALAQALGSGASQLIKHLVTRPRPPDPLVPADFGSLPSGHVITTLAVGLALCLALVRPGRRALPVMATAAATAAMMACRTYLRAHWLTDTFESVAVAGAIMALLYWYFSPLVARERQGRQGRTNVTVMTGDSDETELVRQGYDALSYRYRADDADEGRYGPWLRQLQARLRPGADVLDLGCGCGVPICMGLAAAGHRVTGVDISAVQVTRARQLVPGATFLEADATAVEFEPASFDAIACLYSLIHMPLAAQPDLLRRAAGWLRPAGWLLAVAGHDAWTGTEDTWLGGGTPMWWSQADAATYRSWIEAAGLTVTEQAFVPEDDGGHALFWARKPLR